MNENELLKEIEQMLNDYTVIVCNGICDESFLKTVIEVIEKKGLMVKIVSAYDIVSDKPAINIVSREYVATITKMYCMYHFTDKIYMLSDALEYPSMGNYVHQGILSQNELIEALLYKIG